jgi:hypothetical protein
MPSILDYVPEPPKQPDIGAPEDWERIEEALGYKGADPERRERLYRGLLIISHLYFGPAGQMPEVRAGNVSSALAVLRGHAGALQAYLWYGGRPGKVSLQIRRMMGLPTWTFGRCFTSAPKSYHQKSSKPSSTDWRN